MAPSSSLEARSSFSLWTWKIKQSYNKIVEDDRTVLILPVSHFSDLPPPVSGWSMLALTKLWPSSGCVETVSCSWLWWLNWLEWRPPLTSVPLLLPVSLPVSRASPLSPPELSPGPRAPADNRRDRGDLWRHDPPSLPPVKLIKWRTHHPPLQATIGWTDRHLATFTGENCNVRGRMLRTVSIVLLDCWWVQTTRRESWSKW